MILKNLLATIVVGCAIGCNALPARADVRIKDIVTFEGVRENQLIGYGLVVGLNGSGDTLRNSPFTRRSIEGMLDRLGVGNLTDSDLKTQNTAAVMVTAMLPPFAREGSPIDVVVSSLGDAKSLRGGTLLVTPLTGADGQVYAVGQGPLSASGFSAQGQGANMVKGVPTVARIENGATVEKEVPFSFAKMGTIRMALRNPDLTTGLRIVAAVNADAGVGRARLLDPGTVEVALNQKLGTAGALARLEQLQVQPDSTAKVVVDARSGTIVIGANVRIDQVAISQGGLTVSVQERPEVSQPEPLSIGGTVVVPRTDIKITQKNSGFAVVGGQVSLQQLVDGLNAIGIGAEETISILQAIKAAGALHADLEII